MRLELDSGMIVVRLGAWSYGAQKASQEAWPLGNTNDGILRSYWNASPK